MIYTFKDFLDLERMSNTDLLNEQMKATSFYVEYHSMYVSSDEDNDSEVSLDIILSNLKNIEAYVRKIANLLNDYDDNPIINKIRKRRENYFSKKSISNVRKNIRRKRGDKIC